MRTRSAASSEAELETVVLQRKENRRTRDEWDRFKFHRTIVTEAILAQAAPRADSVCLLGAGNCNDVDLELLASRFERIHLVDLDEKALLFAKNRQSPATRKKLRLHYRLDVSGTIDRLPRWQRLKVSEREVAVHASTHVDSVADLLGTFDCVVSACMLSQLHLAVVRELGAKHPLYDLVAQVTTKTHLRILETLTAMGGSALLITDLTSSDLVPMDLWAQVQAQFSGAQGAVQAYAFNGMLQHFLSQLARGQHTMKQCNPRIVTDVVSDDPHLNSTLHSAAPELVWMWQQSVQRQALVYTFPVVRQSVVAVRRHHLAARNVSL